MKRRLFVDMDGTLARFHDEVQYLERMFEQEFFLNLKPFQEAVDGINNFMKYHPDVEVFILSSAINGEPPYCRLEKCAWINKYLPQIDNEHRIFPPIGEPKANYIPNGITKNDFLWDDYNVGLERWEQDGGTAIKCKNNINHKGLIGKLWEGLLLDNQYAPKGFFYPHEYIESQLYKIVATHNADKLTDISIGGYRGLWTEADKFTYGDTIYYMLENENGDRIIMDKNLDIFDDSISSAINNLEDYFDEQEQLNKNDDEDMER